MVAEIELLCNHFPVQVGELTHQIDIGLLLLDDLSEQFAFKRIPAERGEVVFLHGEPFEHAVACTHSGYQLRYILPVLIEEVLLYVADVVLIAVLGNDPHEHLHIVLTPVLLYLLVLHHLLNPESHQPNYGLITYVPCDNPFHTVHLLTVLQHITANL